MPREPRFDRNRMDLRNGDEAMPKDGMAGVFFLYTAVENV
jgi:hypothetical protein